MNGLKDGELVCIRVLTRFGYSNTWWRIMFIDNDGTFMGKLERYHWHEYEAHKKAEIVKLDIDDVSGVYKEGEQFCYGDHITICNCEGLCNNK